MDATTRERYEAWKRRKILKRAIPLGVLLLVISGGLIFALNTGGNDSETDGPVNGNVTTELPTDIDPDPRTDETGPPETDQPTEDTGATEIRLQFGGDVFIHQGPIDVARTGEHTFDFRPFFQHIAPFVDGDFAMVNMESPVDAFGGNHDVAGWPYFNAPFEILEALTDAGFNHLSSANNHAFDKGFEGLLNTVSNFERAGITHTGLNVDMEDFHTPTLIDINGIQVGVLAYTDIVNHQGLALMPQDTLTFAVRRFRSYTLDDMPVMATDIANLREAGADVVVVSLHWGVEYAEDGTAPNEMQRLIASALSEAGADVIMGHHSKTVQPIEWLYREDGSRTLVMYSLGNFMADQTRLFSPATVDALTSTGTNNSQSIPFAGRTQIGMLVSLQVVKEENGDITLTTAEVLPTLCMRDFSGNTLGTVDGVSVMPLVAGELPDFVTDEELRIWGRFAYEHVVNIVGNAFISNE